MILSTESTTMSKLNPNPPHPRPPKRARSQHSSGTAKKSALASLAELPEPETPRLGRSRTTGSQSQYTSAPRTVVVPSLGGQDLPSIGTRGFTTLVLPRADFHAREPGQDHQSSKSLFKRGGTGTGSGTDITKTGLAQTTMATVEVVKGIAAGKNENKWRIFPFVRKAKATPKIDPTIKNPGKSPLGFTSWRSPPKKVNGTGVMVQVWAIGVDGMDVYLVSPPKLSEGVKGEPMTDPAVGFVPGRSFAGRVVECGWEVNEADIKKGEWVVGLLEVQKVRHPFFPGKSVLTDLHAIEWSNGRVHRC